MSIDWSRVREKIHEKINRPENKLLFGQDRAAKVMADRLVEQNGILLADEVGLGKTRVALMAMDAVLECGGNAAAIVPAGLLSQWEDEYKEYKINIGESSQTAVKIRSFSDLFDYGEILTQNGCGFPLANAAQHRWMLISHAFGFHRVTAKSPPWRVELPTLVRAALEFDKSYRNRWREYVNKYKYDNVDIKKEWRGQYWSAAQYLAKILRNNRLSSSSNKYLSREDFRPIKGASKKCSEEVIEQFRKDGEAYEVMIELIGHIIGTIDLLIIDEAHKSRDDGKDPEKQLGVLVERIIRKSKSHRRISLTATPVELGAYQWVDVLSRTNLTIDRGAIDDFARCLQKAQILPGNPQVIDQLIRSAIGFKSALQPAVIRRRRINQREMQKYFTAPPTQANPHRKREKIPILFDALSDNWRRSILALEGQSLAAKGLPVLSMRERLIDTRYASGLLTFDVDDARCDEANDAVGNAKMQRFIFWKKTAQAAACIGEGPVGLMEHPRIQAAADHIEKNLELVSEDNSNQEKYLVFGRFTAPMRALQKELNARYTLRCMDLNRPLLVGSIDDDTLYALYACYCRLFAIPSVSDSVRRPLVFRGTLSREACGNTPLNKDGLSALINKAVDRHRSEREYVSKILDEGFLLTKLPGDAVIKKLEFKQRDALFSLLRLNVFTELFHDKALSDVIVGSKAEKIRSLAISIWTRYLEGVIEGAEEESVGIYERTGWEGERQYEKIDAFGDRVNPDHLVLSLDLDDANARESSFCRMLHGDTRHVTRKVLQSQFNGLIYPRVLIAQSLVGREGLNLHKKCRRVLLFHPEWNPAVVEQQIGRVDRINSLWTAMADSWHDNGKKGELPKIEVEYLVFEKTYDDYQYTVLESRRLSMNAQLFGELLDSDTLGKVPHDRIDHLLKASPDFEPDGDDQHQS